jgi:hypothetical protein
MLDKSKSEKISLLIIILINLPFAVWLAEYPQDPDSAEMLMTALQGGVLHPPGFPVQAWIDRLLYSFLNLFAYVDSAYPLSILSFILHIVNGVLIFFISRILGAGALSSLVGSIFYSTYPLVMGLALQPDKYTTVQTLIFSVIYFSLASTGEGKAGRNLSLAALFTGLALAHHPVAAISALFLVSALILNIYRKKTVYAEAVLMLAIPLVIAPAFYLSLPLLRNSAYPWPDWGNISSLSDIINHVMRKDLGGIQLNIGTHVKERFTGLDMLVADIIPGFAVFLFLPVFGIVRLFRHEKSAALSLSAAVVSLAGLLGALSNFVSDNSYGYMERYLVFIFPFIFIATSQGIEFFLDMLNRKSRVRLLAASIPLVFIIIRTAMALPYFRGMTNNFVDVYRKNISRALYKEDLFLSGSDFDTFYGVPFGNGTRYPLVDLFRFSWYVEDVLMKLDPAIRQDLFDMNITMVNNFFYFKKYMSRKNYPMVSSSGPLLMHLNREVKRRGILFSVNDQREVSDSDFAVKLCGDLKEVKRGIPQRGHYFIRDILKRFSLLFRDISIIHPDRKVRKKSAEIADLLKPGIDPRLLKKACADFIEYDTQSL